MNRGFTLIEVMVTVAILGILAAVAYPSYVQYVAKSGRSEGIVALVDFANRQEQYFNDQRQYATNMKAFGYTTNYMDTENSYYRLTINRPNTTSMTITATARGIQSSRDSDCAKFTINHLGLKQAFNANGVETTAECWGK